MSRFSARRKISIIFADSTEKTKTKNVVVVVVIIIVCNEKKGDFFYDQFFKVSVLIFLLLLLFCMVRKKYCKLIFNVKKQQTEISSGKPKTKKHYYKYTGCPPKNKT